jgi:uncharacterized membrane protein YphA (DoxX/SURF4 family)
MTAQVRLGGRWWAWVQRVDRQVTRWMARHGVTILRISLGVIFAWFGGLKFLPGASPAEDLATRTIEYLALGRMASQVSLPLLAAWELAIGIGLLTGVFLRTVLGMMLLQMAGTLAPLVIFPNEVFFHVPYAPTLEGQYIIKNAVLISAGIVIGATVRGGRLVAEPAVAVKSAEAAAAESRR